jgi:hypothetical protein
LHIAHEVHNTAPQLVSSFQAQLLVLINHFLLESVLDAKDDALSSVPRLDTISIGYNRHEAFTGWPAIKEQAAAVACFLVAYFAVN